MKRFLMATWDGGGTAPPEMSIARALIARGHEVRVLGDVVLADAIRAAGAEHVPVLYLSNGPWNLIGPLTAFLERNGFPPGALLLTDWGLQPDRWFRDGQAHKRGSLLRLAEDLPGVDWTLVGDTGEHDPALYEEFAQDNGGKDFSAIITSIRDSARG